MPSKINYLHGPIAIINICICMSICLFCPKYNASIAGNTQKIQLKLLVQALYPYNDFILLLHCFFADSIDLGLFIFSTMPCLG